MGEASSEELRLRSRALEAFTTGEKAKGLSEQTAPDSWRASAILRVERAVLSALRTCLSRTESFQRNVFLLCCSGGVDSTALLHAFARALKGAGLTKAAVETAVRAAGLDISDETSAFVQGRATSSAAAPSPQRSWIKPSLDASCEADCEEVSSLTRSQRASVQLHAVYMDHGLRPAETPKEKLFVEALCKAYDIPFHLFEIPGGLVEALKPSVRERRSSKVSTMECAKARRSSPQELLREWRISTAARLARTLLESGEDGESEARESGTALKTFLF